MRAAEASRSFCASVDLAPFELLSCPLNGAPFPAERRQKKDRKQLYG